MTIIIAVTKFTSGAYIILIAIPVVIAALLKVNRHYEEVGAVLRDPERRGPVWDQPRQRVVIPVGAPGPDDSYAVAYGNRVFPQDLRLVHFAALGTGVDYVLERWGHLGQVFELRLKQRSIGTELRSLVRELRADAEDQALINVIIPETVRYPGWRHIVRKWRAQRIKAALVAEAGVVVTNVTHHAGYEELEPVTHPKGANRAMAGWRHVAVVLVSGVHNATAQSLRYALSLRADELHCLHVAVDEEESEKVRHEWEEWSRQWEQWNVDVPLEVLESPHRQIARPIHTWVRRVLEDRPKTFVTIVIPEFVVQKWWHRVLHNQTALTLKGTFLLEPSVVVSAVPYKL
jgi:hypothetical protein